MKRIVSFLLVFCMMLAFVPAFSVYPAATSVARPYDTQPLGDVTSDGEVNTKDILLLRKYISFGKAQMDVAYADIVRDSVVNMKDVLSARKTVAGLLLTTTAFLADNVPAFKDSPAVAIRKNVPDFSSSELTKSAYETYAALDNRGRCGLCMSCIGLELMPTDKRGDISSVHPTGWIQGKYDIVNGGYLYNRCHLIGFQLTGENANVQNLITGTKYLNNDGMLPFENEVAAYIKKTGNHVLYRVEPIFVGNDLLARGVQMEAHSVEDNGAGISFNVFCYNVQKGITLNYADGSNHLTGSVKTQPATTTTKKVTTTTKKTTVTTKAPVQQIRYVYSKNSKTFHRSDCFHVATIKPENLVISDKSRDQLVAAGYKPCKDCNP